MKFIHLADLHLGKSIYEQSLIEDQKYILNQILSYIKSENIDVVLISGDIFDKCIPTIEAINLLDEFFEKLILKEKKQVIAITGNHDSKDRVGYCSKILEKEGLHIVTDYKGRLEKVELNDEHGRINVYMLPFVKPTVVRKFLGEDINSYNEAVKRIIKNTDINKSERNIILVHQFVTGLNVNIETCDSEIIDLGGIDNIDVRLFDDFDYVAMGHIHGPQKLLRDTVRYAGSPLKYSFSECNHKKSVPIFEFNGKDIKLELKLLKPLRDMRILKGNYLDIISDDNIKQYNHEDYIQVILTDETPIIDVISKLRVYYPNILSIIFENSKTKSNDNVDYSIKRIKGKTELDLFKELYKKQNNVDLDEDRIKIISDVIKEIKDETN